MSLNSALGQISPEAAQDFAVMMLAWTKERATTMDSETARASALVTVVEAFNLSLATSSLQNSSASGLVQHVEGAANDAICRDTTVCEIKVSLVPRPWYQDTTSVAANAGVGDVGSGISWGDVNGSGDFSGFGSGEWPSPPFPPPAPPTIYNDTVVIESRRMRNAGYAAQEQQRGQTLLSTLNETLTSNLLFSSMVSVEPPVTQVVELAAFVRISVVADNLNVVYDTASDLFSVMLNTTLLRGAVAAGLGVHPHELLVAGLQAEFMHPTDGLVIIAGALPPPPPFVPLMDDADGPTSALLVVEEEKIIADTATAVTAAVVTAVAASVATSVGGAVAGSVAGSVGGAAGGAAGGSAGGSSAGGASGGGALPLIFGAQRFSVSSGLAVEKDPLQTGVATSMGWITGDFGSSPSEDSERRRLSGRRLQSKSKGKGDTSEDALESESSTEDGLNEQEEEMAALLRTLRTFGILMSVLVVIMLCGLLIWKYRKNRNCALIALDLVDCVTPIGCSCTCLSLKRFLLACLTRLARLAMAIDADYKEQGLSELQRRALYKDDKDKERRKNKDGTYHLVVPKRAKFVGLPGIFVFPGVLFLGVNLFLTGFFESAVYLVSVPASDDQCGTRCMAWAVPVLSLSVLYVCLVFAMLLHFHKSRHSAATWQTAEEPETPEGVVDPLYRLISKIRTRICRKRLSFNVMDRARGEFCRPADDEEEPQRTERLLRRPLSLFRSRPADSLDALKLAWFGRANGSHFVGISYELVALAASLAIGGLNGFGSHIEFGSRVATLQVAAVLTIQYATALYAAVGKPSADRIDNLLTVFQFFVEGTQTLVLLLGGQREGYLLGMIAMCVWQMTAWSLPLAPLALSSHLLSSLTPSYQVDPNRGEGVRRIRHPHLGMLPRRVRREGHRPRIRVTPSRSPRVHLQFAWFRG